MDKTIRANYLMLARIFVRYACMWSSSFLSMMSMSSANFME